MTTMSIVERYEQALAENARLKGLASHSAPPRREDESEYERLLRTLPKFKSFCRRKSDVPLPSMEARLKAARKARAAEIKAYCRPRGPFSILKENEYYTGRIVKDGSIESPAEIVEVARIRKLNKDEWDSELLHEIEPENLIIVYRGMPPFGQDLSEESEGPEQEPIEDEQNEDQEQIEAMSKLLAAAAEQHALLSQLVALNAGNL